MNNKTYSDLLGLIQALAGVDAFTTSESTKMLALVNRRLYEAYEGSPTWPRYYYAAQARPITDGVISRSYSVAGGTRTSSLESRVSTTVTIVCTAAVDFVAGMQVTISGLSGTVSPNGTYTVTGVSTTTVDDDTFTYTLSSGTGSEVYTGTGTITPVALPEIGEFNRIFSGNPYNASGYREFQFVVDSEGAKIINRGGTANGAWVNLKQEWPGPYTTASTDIPQEFFNYTAHAAYADFLRMDGQTDKAIVEEKVAQNYLDIELMKAENQSNVNNSYRRISTYTSRQYR
jgi:hypothetical protein